MLHYHVDNEIMMDLYQNYRMMPQKSLDTFHALGEYYSERCADCTLEEKTELILKRLVKIKHEDEAEEMENKLIHGYLTAKADLRAEETDYEALLEHFDDETRKALKGLSDYVVRQKVIPYRIKNKSLHISVIDTPAMVMDLDFEDVLIADGRHPKEIMMTHISGDIVTDQQAGAGHIPENGPLYQIEFINGITNAAYQTKESAFVFSDVSGKTALYNYATYRTPLAKDADKVPWRLMYEMLDSVIRKIQVLGLQTLNDSEVHYLPLICVFYELIGFYLDEETVAAAGKSMIRFNEEKTDFAFSADDLNNTCALLAPYDVPDLISALPRAVEDKYEFLYYWISYAAQKKSEKLYRALSGIISTCALTYKSHPLPLTCRKYHAVVRRKLNDFFKSHGWQGDFPCFRKKVTPQFLETSNVYSKMYTYINEKNKAYYVDFIESTDEHRYVVSAILGFVLLRDRESEKDYNAMRCWFTDGGRRCASMMGRVVIDSSMNGFDVENALDQLINDILKETRTAN